MNIGKTFCEKNHTNVVFSCSPKAIQIKTKITMGPNKITSFSIAKETINKTKRQPTEWKKISANEATDNSLISKIYKQVIQHKNNKTNNPIEKCAET